MTPTAIGPADWPALAERIARWLPAARWFAGKTATPSVVAIHDAAPLPGGLVLTLVDATIADDDDEGARTTRWVVPVDARTGADAAGRDGLASWIVAMAFSGGALRGEHGRFVGRAVAAERPGSGAPFTATSLGGDASNTSLLLEPTDGRAGAGRMVLKLLRRAIEGENPEVEVGRFLARSTAWRGTPALLAEVAYEPAAEDASAPRPPSTIATLHAFAAGCRSAWEHGLTLAARSNGPLTEALVPLAGRLGATTAGMHEALASRPDIPAFAPRPATRATRRALADRLLVRARAALGRAAGAAVPAETRARLARLADAEGTIVRVLARVAEAGVSAADIRVHGDYHLGQVLVDESGSRLLPIDFEGEPACPLEERRDPTSACKDVAGMCRSFDYLLRQAARAVGRRAEDPAPLVAAFLSGYRKAAPAALWWPTEGNEEAALLGAFTLDKALYELAYELDNRPDWVDVPLAALETLLAD